ncbi:MAG: hypothetical protein J6A01_08705 [Proteobacteria bacterium]|nr:hypothetical protein [Pseudomonadota bacterium]
MDIIGAAALDRLVAMSMGSFITFPDNSKLFFNSERGMRLFASDDARV